METTRVEEFPNTSSTKSFLPNRKSIQNSTKKSILINIIIVIVDIKTNLTYTYNMFGFRQTDYNLLGFDVNLCHPNTARKFFIFRLAKDLVDEVRSNEISFKEAVVKILQQKAQVTVMRVSRVEIAYDDEGVYVFFTLFDRVKEYGPLATHAFKDDTPLNGSFRFSFFSQ